jgi:hypothetical protein
MNTGRITSRNQEIKNKLASNPLTLMGCEK